MKYPTARLSAIAVAILVAGTALAAPPTTSKVATVRSAAESPRHDRWLTMDINNDGVIDRAEAAGHPWLAAKFDQLDSNSDGKLERSELRRGHGKRSRRGGNEESHRGSMGQWGGHMGMSRYLALDTDGDGRISKLEADSSPLAKRFADIDLNKDGYLVRSELQADSKRRRAEFMRKADERFDQQFKQADTNSDGRISRAEFETAWPEKAKLFAFLDEDRDGYLSRADLTPDRGR